MALISICAGGLISIWDMANELKFPLRVLRLNLYSEKLAKIVSKRENKGSFVLITDQGKVSEIQIDRVFKSSRNARILDDFQNEEIKTYMSNTMCQNLDEIMGLYRKDISNFENPLEMYTNLELEPFLVQNVKCEERFSMDSNNLESSPGINLFGSSWFVSLGKSLLKVEEKTFKIRNKIDFHFEITNFYVESICGEIFGFILLGKIF